MNRGFTLIEILLYIVMAVTVILGGVELFSIALNAKAKNQSIDLVNNTSLQVMHIIERNLADEGEFDPGAFYVEDDILKMNGGEEEIVISNENVKIDNFIMQDSSSLVRVEFKATAGTGNTFYESDFAASFYIRE